MLSAVGAPSRTSAAWPRAIGAQSCRGWATPHRRHRLVDQTLSEHRAAEGPADERSHHRVSQCRAPLSPNQMCENLWTLPQKHLSTSMDEERRPECSVGDTSQAATPSSDDVTPDRFRVFGVEATK